MSEVRGTPPARVPVPTSPGYYWVRLAQPRFVSVEVGNHAPDQSYRTWDEPEMTVALVRLYDTQFSPALWTDWMGSDEGQEIEDHGRLLVEVIAKIEEPA